ncbi:hypothetical protein D3C87_1584830 [compost metagenome]
MAHLMGHFRCIKVIGIGRLKCDGAVCRQLLKPLLESRALVCNNLGFLLIGSIDNDLGLCDIHTNDHLRIRDCHGPSSELRFKGLLGFTVALACFYRRSEPMHSLSAH